MPKRLLLGVVSRLTYQKGLDLLLECLPKLLDGGAQLVVLGSGEVDLERRYQQLAQRYPGTRLGHRAFRRGFVAPDHGGSGYFPDAVAFRALRAEPDVRHALRYAAGGAPDGRSGGFGDRREGGQTVPASCSTKRIRPSCIAPLCGRSNVIATKRISSGYNLTACTAMSAGAAARRRYLDLYRTIGIENIFGE